MSRKELFQKALEQKELFQKVLELNPSLRKRLKKSGVSLPSVTKDSKQQKLEISSSSGEESDSIEEKDS